MPSSPAPCPRCGTCETRVNWQTFTNGTKHLRESCACCDRYVRYAKQTAENISRVSDDIPTPAFPVATAVNVSRTAGDGGFEEAVNSLVIEHNEGRLVIPNADLIDPEKWWVRVKSAAELDWVTTMDLQKIVHTSAVLRGIAK